jgi:hypothetical protein
LDPALFYSKSLDIGWGSEWCDRCCCIRGEPYTATQPAPRAAVRQVWGNCVRVVGGTPSAWTSSRCRGVVVLGRPTLGPNSYSRIFPTAWIFPCYPNISLEMEKIAAFLGVAFIAGFRSFRRIFDAAYSPVDSPRSLHEPGRLLLPIWMKLPQPSGSPRTPQPATVHPLEWRLIISPSNGVYA